jgi:exonuclease SbcD
MRFLHLADLHIGKSVNGFSMLGEQRNVFRQIIGYIRAERPTAVVIAGDIYDRAVPSVDAVRTFDDFLTALADEGVAVMVISGNHDSPERLSFASRLLTGKRLFLCGAIEDGGAINGGETCEVVGSFNGGEANGGSGSLKGGNANGGSGSFKGGESSHDGGSFKGAARKVELEDEHGAVNFWLLPFIKPSSVRGMFVDREEEIDSYEDALAAAVEAAGVDYSARNVLVSHQFFVKAGVTPIRSESELNPIGGLDAIDAGIVGKFDYVALGHLHGAQKVGAEHVRYAGSPLKYSFSETRHDKSITLVEMANKGSVAISALPLAPMHDMREIKGELEMLISDEVTSLADKKDYLRVILTDEEEIVDPMGKIRRVYPNVMALGFENTRTGAEAAAWLMQAELGEAGAASEGGAGGALGAAGQAVPAGESGAAGQLSPYDLFREFFLDVSGSAMSEEQAKIVKEILENNGNFDSDES